jgi:hypothetical protein
MRKGIALIELLAAFVAVAAMLITIAALTRPLIIEIPRVNRIMAANTSVHHMLVHLRDDIEAAVRVPDSFGDKRADEKTLLIELPNCVVCYTCANDKVVREVLRGENTTGGKADVWSIPKAKINWQRWQKDGRSYAVEISTHFEYKQGQRIERKLANSRVYFVGASADIMRKK